MKPINTTRVLVFIATYRHHPETLYSVNALQHEATLDIFMSRDNPYKGAEQNKNILHQYQKAQALAAGYDWVLTVEDDMILPADALVRLQNTAGLTRAQVVFGVYHFRRHSLMGNITHPKTGVSIDHKDWIRNFKEARAIPCGGLGWGCTLIDAQLFAATKLRTANMSYTDSDTCFAEDMRKAGVVMYADFGVRCGHIRPDGAILYPGAEQTKPRIVGELKRWEVEIEAIDTFGGRTLDNVMFVVRRGERAMLDSELAYTLQTAGQLKIIGERHD
jgi:hypothetical protein